MRTVLRKLSSVEMFSMALIEAEIGGGGTIERDGLEFTYGRMMEGVAMCAGIVLVEVNNGDMRMGNAHIEDVFQARKEREEWAYVLLKRSESECYFCGKEGNGILQRSCLPIRRGRSFYSYEDWQ